MIKIIKEFITIFIYMGLVLLSIVVCLLIFSLNLLADGLRDAVDPKMRNQ